jgi:hypothetical protein
MLRYCAQGPGCPVTRDEIGQFVCVQYGQVYWHVRSQTDNCIPILKSSYVNNMIDDLKLSKLI